MSYTNRRNVIALGLLAALAGLGSGKVGEVLRIQPRPGSKPKRDLRKPETVRVHWRAVGCYKPHQGERERLRRIGGKPWALYKRADRIFRGLEPAPAPQSEHRQQVEAYALMRAPEHA